MLYFRTKPDAAFLAILHQALGTELQEVTRISVEDDYDAWEGAYGQVCASFTPYSAIVTLEQLLIASRKETVFRLTDYHWLLIYECLKNYCAIHRDLAEQEHDQCLSVGEYRLSEIDFEEIVVLYFWDTDFLFLRETDQPQPTCGSLYEDSFATTLDITHNLQPHPRYLQLRPEEDPAWTVLQPHESQQILSGRYPDFS